MELSADYIAYNKLVNTYFSLLHKKRPLLEMIFSALFLLRLFWLLADDKADDKVGKFRTIRVCCGFVM